ncbi:nitroreductase [Umboniibacter marinipuniceus]|uniref:Nitroreductase n=1 Tax=Umboniibacter marinipuniceus TaxID=569599 RepID=A0A3M0AF25_9GAMM|nr:nitroreductase [Umboniibacter marinipuniceus]RMA82764.1 nitroreductase [Umboniibacter marinipuniceus]
MNFQQVVESRRSVRGFLPKTIPHDTLTRVLKLANLAPSNCNIQPWHVFVASGESLAALKAAYIEAATSTPPKPDYPSPRPFPEPYRQRQIDCAIALYNEMGIARGDKLARDAATLRNFEFFDAPHVLFIGMNAKFGASVALDVGMYAQTLMLALTAEGLASCAQGALRQYPQIVRDFFELDDDINILMGLSFGYEDTSVAANHTRVGREDITSSVIFRE